MKIAYVVAALVLSIVGLLHLNNGLKELGWKETGSSKSVLEEDVKKAQAPFNAPQKPVPSAGPRSGPLAGTIGMPAPAPNVQKFTGPKGEPCTRVTDDNGNVVTQCGTGNSVTLGPAPSAGPRSGPLAGTIGMPPERAQPGGQSAQPTPPTSAPINLVGKWSYQTVEENVPEDVLIIFQANGHYNQFIRFPQTPVLGKQILQIWGQYTLQGATLTVTPAGATVQNGPNPHQLCNVTTRQCITPDTSHGQTFDLQVIDENTIQTPLGVAERLP
jgi:hypothetical protein